MTGDMLWAGVALILMGAAMIIYVFAMAIEAVVAEYRQWSNRDGS